MLTVLLVIIIILALASAIYHPWGTGAYSYAPSLLLWVIVVIILLYVVGIL